MNIKSTTEIVKNLFVAKILIKKIFFCSKKNCAQSTINPLQWNSVNKSTVNKSSRLLHPICLERNRLVHFRKRRLSKPPRIKSKTGCPELDLLTEFHCIYKTVAYQRIMLKQGLINYSSSVTEQQGLVWNGMENGMEWNGNFGMEYARMEWNGRFQEWNGRQSSILPYQFHTKFCSMYLQKNKYRCRVVINNIVTEVFNFNIYAYYLSTNAVLWLCTLCKQCTYCIIVSTLQFNCNIDVTVDDDLDKFDLFFFLF